MTSSRGFKKAKTTSLIQKVAFLLSEAFCYFCDVSGLFRVLRSGKALGAVGRRDLAFAELGPSLLGQVPQLASRGLAGRSRPLLARPLGELVVFLLSRLVALAALLVQQDGQLRLSRAPLPRLATFCTLLYLCN